ncbi:hypothetical protein [Sphingobium sp. SYK-6]|uniref:hypothetical protein n=1 Tax=Sphingobium sp. (strain NBRC 103272 / SYK-6) TaxID=627192 RepID=UPI0011D18110|nr:hypothetical protein [Sphingobium sp. SYK-6]
MPLQIVEFNDLTPLHNGVAQVSLGSPVANTDGEITGEVTLSGKTRIIKIVGDGTIDWGNDTHPEPFRGVEFRGVKPGTQFTVA